MRSGESNASTLQALVDETKAAVVPIEDLQRVSPAVVEDEHASAEGVVLEVALHHGSETINVPLWSSCGSPGARWPERPESSMESQSCRLQQHHQLLDGWRMEAGPKVQPTAGLKLDDHGGVGR